MADTTFPVDFLWGAATSAYQIEGSPLADGAGASNWHNFVREANRIEGGDRGDVACDHYRRYADDVRLMADLGLQSYRLSVSWSRILPTGTGRVNPLGVDFYKRLLDTLLEHNIRPNVTLYHWDLPAALEERGGWAHRDMPRWFADYARVVYRELGDRVDMWVTINEPWVVFDCGYVSGIHAPGRRDWAEAAAVSQNLVRAHSAAVAVYRAERGNAGQIGLVVNLVPIEPDSDSDADRQAARRHDAYLNRQFLDPVLLAQVPEEMPEMFDAAWPAISDDELREIQQPIDFIGINYYLRLVVRNDPKSGPSRAAIVPQPNCPKTATDWEIYAPGLLDTLTWVKQRYGDLPLLITENGAAFDDEVQPDGAVHDPRRVQYLAEHLRVAREAIAQGVNLRGYYVWSLLDNFEWHCGFSKRFGIVYVDYGTETRIPKTSAGFFSQVIRTNGAALEDC